MVRRTLFWKYVALFVAVTSSALVINGLVDVWFTVRDHRAALFRIQKEQAVSAASKITQFIREIEGSARLDDPLVVGDGGTRAA